MYGYYLPRIQPADGRMRTFVHRGMANKEEVGFLYIFLNVPYLSCND